MRYPQVIVHEDDGALARALQPLTAEKKWTLRQPRRTASCLHALTRARPGVLVLKTGRDVVKEMSLLERARWLCPEVPALVVGEAEGSPLALLAWHLGASYVLAQSQARDQLAPLVAVLMQRVFDRLGLPAPTTQASPTFLSLESLDIEADE